MLAQLLLWHVADVPVGARNFTKTAMVGLHTRGAADVPDRVEAIRAAAAAGEGQPYSGDHILRRLPCGPCESVRDR